LFIHIKRFSKNNFFKEKNPTIVNFPLKGLDMEEILGVRCKYDLIGNVVHSGKADSGSYRVQVIHHTTNEWFDIQDLIVTPIIAQQVVVSESYILLYKK